MKFRALEATSWALRWLQDAKRAMALMTGARPDWSRYAASARPERVQHRLPKTYCMT
jgi:hypothetical protein